MKEQLVSMSDRYTIIACYPVGFRIRTESPCTLCQEPIYAELVRDNQKVYHPHCHQLMPSNA